MSDPQYELIAELPLDGKPYTQRVWKTPTGFFVKTRTTEKPAKFGRLSWSISGSLTDANGKALLDAFDRPLVHGEAHIFRVVAERIEDDADAQAIAQRMRIDFDASHKLIIARVERAAMILASARATL